MAAEERLSRANFLLLAISYLGFVSLGFPDAVIGVAWPSARETFGVGQSSLGWILFGAGAGYFVSSFLSGRAGQRLGIGLMLALSSGLVAASAFGYAAAPVWALFAACSILHGLGSGAIDAGLNNYVAHRYSARVMNWLHACYCLGAMLGPLVMTAALARGAGWRSGYAAIGVTMLALTMLFAGTIRLWGKPAADVAARPETASSGETLRSGLVRTQMLIFFVYTGLEVTCGQWSYTVMTEARGVEPAVAGMWVSVYWGAIGAGRVLFGLVVDRIGIDRVLRWATLGALAGVSTFALSSSHAGMFAGLALTGFWLAPVYPCLMTATPRRLGSRLAAHAIGFQTGAAMIGAAALPTLAGYLASHRTLETIPGCAVGFAAAMWALHERALGAAKR